MLDDIETKLDEILREVHENRKKLSRDHADLDREVERLRNA
jgi:uncharacterized protein YaaN involved in tellurite resistance